MKSIFRGREFLYPYIFIIAAGIFFAGFSLVVSHGSSLFFLLASLYLVISPGWLLGRLLRLQTRGVMQLLSFFSLGLIFYLIINLLAIFLGLNLDSLMIVYFVLGPLLFIAAVIYDFLKPPEASFLVDYRSLFKKENLVYLLPVILSFFIFLVVGIKGADFNGDPYYHLAIVRKVIENSSLSPASLSFTKVGTVNPAYGFPAWHVLIAMFSRILQVDIFTVWSQLTLPLLVFTLLVWFQFSRVLFGKKNYAVIAFIFFACFTFFGNAGYLFQRLTMPDTLAQFLLMPLSFIFYLNYLYRENADAKKNTQWLILYFLSLIALLIVHGIHYFYVVYAVLLFSLVYLFFNRKEYRRTLLSLGTTLGPLIILGGLMELKNGFISDTWRHFSGSQNVVIAYSKFANMGLRVQYSLLLAPLLVLFFKRMPRLLFLVVLMSLTPLVYWTPLRDISSRLFSFVFTDRLMGNVALYYFVFAVLITFLLIIFDEAVSTLSDKAKKLYFSLISIIGLMLISLEVFHQSLSRLFEVVFYSDRVSTFLVENGLLVLGLILAFTLVILFLRHYRKDREPIFQDFKSNSNVVIFSFLLILLLISPSLSKSQEVLASVAYPVSAQSRIIDGGTVKDEDWHFLANLPKSVILADDESSKQLSTLVNHYMAFNLSSAAENELMAVFNNELDDAAKIQLIQSPIYQINYLYVRPAYANILPFLNRHPEAIQQIYNGEAKIYRVIK